MKPHTVIFALIVAIIAAGIVNANARSVRHHRRLHAASGALTHSQGRSAVRNPDRFYPNEIKGGVSGNLPFNNQLRKLSDPLNANGGGG